MDLEREINALMREIKYHEDMIIALKSKLGALTGLEKTDGQALSTMHVSAIRKMLDAGVSKTKTAKLLGISRLTLYRCLDDKFRLYNNAKVNQRMKDRLKARKLAATPPTPAS